MPATKQFPKRRHRGKEAPFITEGSGRVSFVGKNIDAFCSRCGFTLAHIVLYETGGTVRGVQCKTCGVQHRPEAAP